MVGSDEVEDITSDRPRTRKEEGEGGEQNGRKNGRNGGGKGEWV